MGELLERRLAIDFRCRPVSCLTTRFYHFLVKGLSSVERFFGLLRKELVVQWTCWGYWTGRRLRLIVYGKRSKDPLQQFGTGRKSSCVGCDGILVKHQGKHQEEVEERLEEEVERRVKGEHSSNQTQVRMHG